jgi:hypothetical protein
MNHILLIGLIFNEIASKPNNHIALLRPRYALGLAAVLLAPFGEEE